MFLADATDVKIPTTAVVYTLDGVTTVLVLFMFVCLVIPTLVKNRTQYYAAMACIMGVVLLHMLDLMFSSSAGLINLVAVGISALQLLALILFVLCVGGLSAKELGADMARAYEVIRRGETTKETIIPIGDQAPFGKRKSEAPRGDAPSQKVYKMNTPSPAAPVTPVEEDDDDERGIPLV